MTTQIHVQPESGKIPHLATLTDQQEAGTKAITPETNTEQIFRPNCGQHLTISFDVPSNTKQIDQKKSTTFVLVLESIESLVLKYHPLPLPRIQP